MQDVATKSERGRRIEQAVSQTKKAVGRETLIAPIVQTLDVAYSLNCDLSR